MILINLLLCEPRWRSIMHDVEEFTLARQRVVGVPAERSGEGNDSVNVLRNHSGATRQLNRSLFAVVCLLVLPLGARAQLPAPTCGWNLGITLGPPCGEGCRGPVTATRLIFNALK